MHKSIQEFILIYNRVGQINHKKTQAQVLSAQFSI